MRTSTIYLGAIFLELCLNNFMQISVDIQWAHHDTALCDYPNETFAVFYYWPSIKYRWRQTFCPIDFLPNQLLPKNINDLFFVEETFDHVLGNKIDHVSFLNMNRCKCGTQNDCLHILFFYNPNRFFCNSWNLFNCKCNWFKVKLNYRHRENFVVTLGPEAEH